MQYELKLTTTSSGTGYFEALPVDVPALNDLFEYLKTHPNDEFMHKYMLKIIATFDAQRVTGLIRQSLSEDPVLAALIYEACLLNDKFFGLGDMFPHRDIERLSTSTPLVYIKSSIQPDRNLHLQWMRIFKNNMEWHQPLPTPDETGLPALYNDTHLFPLQKHHIHIREVCNRLQKKNHSASASIPLPKETARHAFNILHKFNVFADVEKRHVSSLSPCALLRQWRLHLTVNTDRHTYTLSGMQTSYGKGLSIDTARASCLMEIVERYSSFAGFDPENVSGYIKAYPLIVSSYDAISKSGKAVLNPNHLSLETEYRNEPLYWMEGEMRSGDDLLPILVPVQSVFLFCNLDEINLSNGIGSTGLASGNSVAEAKVSAILEVIERDLETITPYNIDRCFTVDAHDPGIAVLLEDYKAAGIHILFQDLSSEMGVPCYKCFVIGPQGQIIKGTSAHLDGKRAVLSALMETPYPYPLGPPSSPGIKGLPTFWFEDLPDYSTGDPETNLAVLETLLAENNYHPVYVDLTRKDIGIPVVKALIPGMEWATGIDGLSRVPLRLYDNYLRLF